MSLVSNPKPGDDVSVRQAIARLGSSKLGPKSSPKFLGVTTTSLTISGLTTNSLIYPVSGLLTSLGVATNGKIPIGSTGAVPVLAEITGTANQVISTPGAGSITLSTPQDIHTGAIPTFAGMILNGTVDVGLDMSSGTFATAIQKWPAGTIQSTGDIAFQPTADSTTAYQWLDQDGGTPVLSIDTTNERVGIRTDSPSAVLDVVAELGPDLVTNGGFDTDSDWTLSGSWTISAGKAHDTGSDGLSQVIGSEAGKLYRIFYDVTDYTSGALAVYIGNNGVRGPERTGTGSFEEDLIAGTSGNNDRIFFDGNPGGASFVGSIDNVVVKEVLDAVAIDGNVNIKGSGTYSGRMVLGTSDSQARLVVQGDIIHEDTNLDNTMTFSNGNLISTDSNLILRATVNELFLQSSVNGIDYRGTYHTWNNNTNSVEWLRLHTTGFLGIWETAPETLTEWSHAQPYLTLHNTTHEDTDGGRESRLNFKGEQSGGEETTLARIEISHDGSGDDQNAKMVFGVNTGAGVVDVLAIRSSTDWVINKTSGVGIKVDLSAPTFGWRDLKGKVTQRNTGASKPTHATYRDTLAQYQFAAGKEEYFTYHIDHDHVPGSDIFLHVHWSHTGASVTGGTITIEYEIGYAKGFNQAAFGASVSTTYTGTASTIQYQHVISEIQISATSPSASQIDSDDLEPDGIIECRIKITSNDITVSGGGVPDPFIHEADIHYQSTGMGTKQRSPDFYV